MIHAAVCIQYGEGAKIKTMIISSEGLTCNSAKFCTSENFPLYSTKTSEKLGIWKSKEYTLFGMES